MNPDQDLASVRYESIEVTHRLLHPMPVEARAVVDSGGRFIGVVLPPLGSGEPWRCWSVEMGHVGLGESAADAACAALGGWAS